MGKVALINFQHKLVIYSCSAIVVALKRVGLPSTTLHSTPHTPGERNNAPEIVFHDNIGIKGRNVIIIDDAIESGGTMKRLVEHLSENYIPQSVSVAVLFVKPGRVSIPARCYHAYEMENDDLLIGYGMPWQNKYRNLPCASQFIEKS